MELNNGIRKRSKQIGPQSELSDPLVQIPGFFLWPDKINFLFPKDQDQTSEFQKLGDFLSDLKGNLQRTAAVPAGPAGGNQSFLRPAEQPPVFKPACRQK
ncbi:MAG: hypothetical protein LBK52_00170 [Deltaproteobacteria bacterium]|jgi:hypothetical protein|nr:hypothetical protein [Deltaproteobacteria bacterium]